MAERNTVTLSDSDRGLRAAAGLLRAGELVAFPTETVYGLGGDARDDRAVAAHLRRQGPAGLQPADRPRRRRSPPPSALAVFAAPARALAARFWPGPLTLVLPRRPDAGLSELATAGPADRRAARARRTRSRQRLLAAFGGPLAAPSANPSGAGQRHDARRTCSTGSAAASPRSSTAAPARSGSNRRSSASRTARRCCSAPAASPVEAIAAALGRPLARAGRRHAITAPGQLASHYAPRAALRLDAAGPGPDEVWLGFGPRSPTTRPEPLALGRPRRGRREPLRPPARADALAARDGAERHRRRADPAHAASASRSTTASPAPPPRG